MLADADVRHDLLVEVYGPVVGQRKTIELAPGQVRHFGLGDPGIFSGISLASLDWPAVIAAR